MEVKMRPPKGRIAQMSRLLQADMAAEATQLVDQALTETDDDPARAVGWLLNRYPAESPLIASSAQRMIVLLALRVLFAFAPGTEAALRALESEDLEN
jgi:hypothetical protein